MSTDLIDQVQATASWIKNLRQEISKVIVGQEQLVDRLLVGLLANGHVLLEGVPGLAKTLSVRTLATAIQASFHRIQFTPERISLRTKSPVRFSCARSTCGAGPSLRPNRSRR